MAAVVIKGNTRNHALERDFALNAYQDRDLVFADQLGGPIHPQRLTEWFRQHRKAAGVPTGTLHVLRHTAVTIALTNGVPVHIVAARLGDTPATLLSTYSHLLPRSDEIAAERVAAALSAWKGERDGQPAQPNPPRPDSAVGGWAGSPTRD